MLVGEFTHTIDAKGRMFIPAKLRIDLGESFVMCKGLDSSLWMYPTAAWTSFNQKLDSLSEIESRRVRRFFYASATELIPDAQGRIILTAQYREFAKLKDEAVLVGNSNRVEIWNPDAWRNEQNAVNNDELVNTLIKMGF